MYVVARDTPPPRSQPEPAGPLKIELAIPCSHCGYVLTGLRTDGICPECAAPIGESVRGERLEFAAPKYVRALRIGAPMVSIVIAFQILCTMVTVIPLLFFMIGGNGPPPMWLQGTFWFTFIILPGLAAGVALGGWWLISAPDPARIGTAADPRTRRWLRIVLAIETFCWVVLVGLGLTSFLTSIPPEVYIPIATASAFVAPLAILAHLLISARFFNAISGRLRSEFAEKVVGYQTIGACVCTGLVLLCILAVYLNGDRLALMVFLITLTALCVLGGIHIAMLEIIRGAAREATAAQKKDARRAAG